MLYIANIVFILVKLSKESLEVENMKLLKVYLFVCIASFLVSAQAETKIISVNYHDSAGTEGNGRQIAASSVQGAGDYATDGWINTLQGQNIAMNLSDGTATTVGLFSRRPNGATADFSGDSSAHNGTPLRGFATALLSAGAEPHIELSNMNANFPDGYKIIVYVGGDSNNNGWSLTLNEGVTHTGFDKATGTTYFGKTRYNPNAPGGSGNGWADNGYEEVDYSVSGLTDASPASAFPLANYVVYDELSADSLTITLDAMKNNKAGIGGFQIVGTAGGGGEPELPPGFVLYNDFSNYTYKDLSIPAGGTANTTYHSRNTGKYIGGASKGVFVRAKRNPYKWNDSSTWFVNHSYSFKFGETNAVNPKFIAPSDSTGGAALKIGLHGPRVSTGSIILNTGIKFDPSINYTVTISAKIKDEVDNVVLSNAVGNVSLSAGFGNLARVRNPYAAISQAVENDLTSTNWTEVSVDVYGGGLAQNAVFGENAFANSGFGPNSSHNRIPNNKINLDNYYPQELMVSIGRSPDSTNTLDHSTWVEWIKIETNNYIDSVASGYGLSSTNLLGDSDSDGQSDLAEIATGGNPTNAAIKGAGLSIVQLKDVIRPIYVTNNITTLPNQNDDGQVPEIINYPVTNFVLTNDAKYGITNIIVSEHRFGGTTWTNYVEHVQDTLPPVISLKWKETVEEIIDLSLSNYTFEVVTLWDQAHVTNNNVYVDVDIIGSYTNSLDNGVDVVSSLFTNEISVTKTGELAIVGYQTNSVVRFKRPRLEETSRLGCKYSIAGRESLILGSWTNSGAYDFGDTYNATNFPGVEIGTSTAPQLSNGGFLQLRVTSPDNDPSTFYFDTFPDTDYGAGDPGN